MSQDTKDPGRDLEGAACSDAGDLAEQIALHVDGISSDGRTWFRCHCCSADFLSAKPQDPHRDLGYGTCQRCHEGWLHRGATPDARAAADERFERYA
jgi:hypothetical protein